MDMIPWTCIQPSSDLCMPMRDIVINDEMDVARNVWLSSWKSGTSYKTSLATNLVMA